MMDKLLQIADSIAPSLAEGLRGPLQAQALLFVFKQFKVKTVEQLEEKLISNDKSLALLQNAQTNYEIKLL